MLDPVREADEGFYECQVNTRGKLSLVFKLNVERESKIRQRSSNPTNIGITRGTHETSGDGGEEGRNLGCSKVFTPLIHGRAGDRIVKQKKHLKAIHH